MFIVRLTVVNAANVRKNGYTFIKISTHVFLKQFISRQQSKSMMDR